MDFCIWTHLCYQLGIWFPYHISHQVQSFPIVLIMLLYLSPASMHFPTGIFFTNFLVYSVHLFLLIPSFSILFGVFFQNFQTSFHVIFLIFLLTHLNHKKKITIKIKNKTTNLTGGRKWSFFLLTFPRAILRPLLIVSALLLSILSNWAMFLSWPSTKS